MVKILPILDKETYEKVLDAALANGHEVIQPTHMVLKDGEIVGGFSIQVTCASWWMDTEHSQRRDSLQAFHAMDALIADRGHNAYIMPCREDSPYFELMERGEFKKFKGDWGIFYKKLK